MKTYMGIVLQWNDTMYETTLFDHGTHYNHDDRRSYPLTAIIKRSFYLSMEIKKGKVIT